MTFEDWLYYIFLEVPRDGDPFWYLIIFMKQRNKFLNCLSLLHSYFEFNAAFIKVQGHSVHLVLNSGNHEHAVYTSKLKMLHDVAVTLDF
jgi:hypothetical protein